MSRETVAQIELDKAEERIRKNGDLVRQLTEFLKNTANSSNTSLNTYKKYTEINGKKYTDAELKALEKTGNFTGVANAVTGVANDLLNGESTERILVGFAFDATMMIVTKFIPVVGWVTLWYDIGNLLDKLDGNDSGIFDLRKQIQDLFTDGLPDIDQNALTKGILRITMPDGTVYARPLPPSFFPYGVTPSGYLEGKYKDDVLFGYYGDDTLEGGIGSDLLIGGYGDDTYKVGNGDIIRDSDHKGSVHFNGHHLTGGTYDEDRDLYISDDYIEYKLDGNTLTVSDMGESITIENYSKKENSLGIVLLDKKDILVTISDESKAEGHTANQSMNFTIKLNRKLEKDEYLNLLVWGNDGKSEIVSFKSGQDTSTYTYKWDGDKIPQEDKKFKLHAGVWTKSDSINFKGVTGGNGVIKNIKFLYKNNKFTNLNLLVA